MKSGIRDEPQFIPMLITTRCDDDRACEYVCPKDAITIEDFPAGGRRWSLTVAACTGCGQCIQVCPQKAITAKPPNRDAYTKLSWVLS